MISVRHLCKEYANATPLKDVNVDIKRGEVVSIIGPSGTGKSTFLRMLNRLEEPTSGTIIIDGIDTGAQSCEISQVRQKMGMVFQNFNLFKHMNIIENIMYAPMKVLGLSKEHAYKRGMKLLRIVGLEDKELNYPDELSGGQRPVITRARKSIANFKVRQGMPVGAKVTLRGDNMYEFVDKLFNIALPRLRDFKGVSKNSFDGRGNYSMGLKEQLIFPEISYDKVDKIKGMNIVFTTTAKTDEEAAALLAGLGLPFEK